MWFGLRCTNSFPIAGISFLDIIIIWIIYFFYIDIIGRYRYIIRVIIVVVFVIIICLIIIIVVFIFIIILFVLICGRIIRGRFRIAIILAFMIGVRLGVIGIVTAASAKQPKTKQNNNQYDTDHNQY